MRSASSGGTGEKGTCDRTQHAHDAPGSQRVRREFAKLSIRDVSMSVSAMSTPVDLTVLVQQFVLFES